jgi:hypothetical protein
MKMIIKNVSRGRRGCDGQAMLVSVLFISGLILSATTIAGLLMVYQIRQATDAGSSAVALFAADAGVETALYCYLQEATDDVDIQCSPDRLVGALGSASFQADIRCVDAAGDIVDCDDDIDVVRDILIRSVGRAGNTERVLEARIEPR